MSWPDVDQSAKSTRRKRCIVIRPGDVNKFFTIMDVSEVKEVAINMIVLIVVHSPVNCKHVIVSLITCFVPIYKWKPVNAFKRRSHQT